MAAPRSLLKGFEKQIETVQADPSKRLTIFDDATTGLCLRVSPKGRKTFMIVARGPDGKQVWREVAKAGDMPLADVRAKAREGVQRVKSGLDPFPEAPKPAKVETFGDVADAFLARHVRKEGQGVPALRSAPAIERQFRDLIGPEWNSRPFAEIGRHDVAKLRDKVATERGPVMADRVLASLSTLFRQQRDYMPDDWQPPMVARRTKGSERARSRVLFDVNREEDELQEAGRELRLLWKAAEEAGPFGAFVRLLVLTGQRRNKVAAMRWDDLDLDRGTWTIATERREKGNAEKLKLPTMALDILKAQPRIGENPFVFAARANSHICGFGPLKRVLDAKIAEANGGQPLEPWTIHDLRRTSRTLLSRAGVQPHVSERVLGHALGTLEAIYEHYNWADAKAKALAKLAKLVEVIVNPPAGKVVQFRKARA
jgi:integrase